MSERDDNMAQAHNEAAQRAEAALGEWLDIEPDDLCYVVIGFSTSQFNASKAFGFRPDILLKANTSDPLQIAGLLASAGRSSPAATPRSSHPDEGCS